MTTLSADDRLAILERLGFYCRCIDTGLWAELPKLFTPDCVVDGGPLGGYEGTAGVEQMGALIKGLGQTMRHYVANAQITGSGDAASSHAYVLAVVGKPGAQHITTGFYEDDWAKRDGQWLLRRRKIVLDMQAG